MRKTLFAIACTALSSGCSNASEQSFNEEFDKNFRASCVSSSTKGGVPTEIAEKTCDCSITEINKKYSTSEKAVLSEQDAMPLMIECLNKVVPR